MPAEMNSGRITYFRSLVITLLSYLPENKLDGATGSTLLFFDDLSLKLKILMSDRWILKKKDGFG